MDPEAAPSQPPATPRAPYPPTSPWAVAARLTVLFTAAAVAFASLAPPRYVPHVLYSYHLEHFAAFYVVALAAAAALPRARLRNIGATAVVLAALLEGSKMFVRHGPVDAYQNFLADVGGAFAAVLPIAVDRFRRLFMPRENVA